MKNFDQIILEKEQEELLSELVELERSLPQHKREAFLIAGSGSGHTLISPGHPDRNKQVSIRDLEILAGVGLVHLSGTLQDSHRCYVKPLGFRYYEYLKTKHKEPFDALEREISAYLASDAFIGEFSDAYHKWVDAEQILWSSDSQEQLTTIGHLCRESLQSFTSTLVEKYNPPEIDSDRAKTINRLRTIINYRKPQLGQKVSQLLESLILYWGAVNDLAQRQEHGAQKEGEQLVWEDGRRCVFQTAIIMYEISRIL